MRKILIAFITLLSLSVPSFAFAQEDTGGLSDFSITKYVAAVDVHTDGSFRVTEAVDVKFFVDRHGIFRNIPVHYTNDSGNNLSIKLDIVSVKADAVDEPYTTSMSGNDLVIKVGDPNRTVKGDVSYEIVYDVTRAVLFTDTTDEIYWNATGTNWPVIPYDVTSTVTLPAGVDASKVESSCYTGDLGSTQSDCEKSVVETHGRATLTATAHTFLTVAARFSKGIITRPTAWQKVLWFAQDNKVVALPLVLFVLLYAYWMKNGRDPKTRAYSAEFNAPEGLTPAELGVLDDAVVHDRDLSATIVDLAVRGYLKIIETETKGVFGASSAFTIERTAKPLEGLKKHEGLILKMVMGDAQRRDLSDMSSRAKDVQTLRKQAQDGLYAEMVEKKWFVSNPETIRGAFSVVAVILIVVAFWFVSGFSTAWMVSLIACGIIVGIFGRYMPKRTALGTELYEKTLGFKEYLSRAEKYRIEWQEKEKIFEKYLPYAMIFLVADKWSNALKDVINQPDWYQSSRPGAWDAMYFNNSMNNLNRSLNSAVMVQPKSASSGGSGIGGGFSGGGFGGGGGGSW